MICILGSLNMDLVVRAPRLPRPGETLLGGPFHTFPGGKGANQAVAAARLGGQVAMIGRVGDDAHGRALRKTLAAEDIDVARVRTVPEAETGVALITVDERGENTIVVAPGANAQLGTEEVCESAEDWRPIERAGWLVAQLETPIATVTRAFVEARRANTRTLLNAAPAAELPRELLRCVNLLVVNRGEAALVASRPSDCSPEELARSCCELGCGAAVVTLGRDGAVAWNGRELLRQTAFEVEAVDAVAAGDAFVGALAVCLGEGRPLREALRFASAAGALATTTEGAQPSLPTRTAVEAILAACPD